MKKHLLLLLLMLLPACRAHRSTLSSDLSTHSTLNSQLSTLTSQLSTSSRDVTLLDVRIDFFPPDSLNPDAPPAPKSLTVARAEIADSSSLSTLHTTLSTDSIATTSRQSTLNSSQSTPSSPLSTLNSTLIIIAIVIALVIFYRRL